MIDQKTLFKLIEATLEAGFFLRDHDRENLCIRRKKDDSPVTPADEKAEKILVDVLSRHTRFPIVGEEMAAQDMPSLKNTIKDAATFWLVDALDGTKEYIDNGSDYTVNIGLIHEGKPVLGIVYAPSLDELYFTKDGQSFKATSKCWSDSPNCIETDGKDTRQRGLKIIGSRRHGDQDQLSDFLKPYDVDEMVSAGSSLKFCRIAEGSAHFYPRFGPTCEWDTAAADAILRASGGTTHAWPDKKELRYGKYEDAFYNPHFVAVSDIKEFL